MKVLILALWTTCQAGPPDHALPVPSLAACEGMGPAVAQTVRDFSWESASFACLFQEEPAPDPEACYP